MDVPKYIVNSDFYRASYCYVVVHESSEETLEQVPFTNGASGAAINRVIQVHPVDLKKGKVSSDQLSLQLFFILFHYFNTSQKMFGWNIQLPLCHPLVDIPSFQNRFQTR